MDFETLKQVIVDTLSCDEDKVTMEATLAEDLGADSLDAVELNMAIEESCGQHEDRRRHLQLPAGSR